VKTYLNCLPCFMSQALAAARVATNNENIHRDIINEVAAMTPEFSLDVSPPETALRVYNIVRQVTGNSDPFKDIKIIANQRVLDNYTNIKDSLSSSEDPLLTACKLAISANSIDLGLQTSCDDIDGIIDSAISSPLSVDCYKGFRHAIENSSHILYLGDNAGEIVFDRILIEELRKIKELDITFVVRESPVINDATMQDAIAVGMDTVANVISSGCHTPGTVFSQCSPEMLDLYKMADAVISKGHGNYECLSDEESNIIFMLKAKCPLVARLLGANVGGAVLMSKNGYSPSV